MLKDGKIWLANANGQGIYLLPEMSNRHGLIAGATGTGKTITLKVIAEAFSDMGVPVFLSDIKGDLSGMCESGKDSEDMQRRISDFGIEDWTYHAYPCCFWDIFGEKGHPVRMTISGLGPMLLSRLLGLSDVQEGVLNIVFKVADDQGLKLLDLKDLRAMLKYVGDNRDEYTLMYGNVATSSIGAIQRALLAFEQEGAGGVFGEPALNVKDWIRTDSSGHGYINILSSERLFQSPATYATFMLWMLTELYETLPEVGDIAKPRIAFFFDEAHCLFDDTPKALHQKITQIIRLIRSKGVGIFFITQNPSDIPDDVLGQLNNRIQHGLRAYTPKELKGVKAAVSSFRVNPAFDTEDALSALGTGQALISLLDEKGVPGIVEKANILPPQSLMGAAPAEKIDQIIKCGEFELKYRESIDNESAYEIIMKAEALLKNPSENSADENSADTAGNNNERLSTNESMPAEGEQAAANSGSTVPGDKQSADESRQAAVKSEQAAAVSVQPAAEKEPVYTNMTEKFLAEKKKKAEAAAANEVDGKNDTSPASSKKSSSKTSRKSASSGINASDTAYKAAKSAATNATSTVSRAISRNLINSVTGSGSVTSASTIGKRAATNALSAVMRTGASSILRGLFGNIK